MLNEEQELLEQTRNLANELAKGNDVEQIEETSSEQSEETQNSIDDTSTEESTTDEQSTEETNSEEEKKEIDITKLAFEKPIMLKHKSMELPIDNMDELIKLAQKGIDYTKKTTELAAHRRTLEYLKNQGIDESDLQMLGDLKSGNKQAIQGFSQKYGVDLLEDINPDTKYIPQTQIPQYSAVDEVASDILANEQLASQFQSMLPYVPETFKAQLSTDANILRAFATDIESGVAQRIMPEASKILALNPSANFLDVYASVGNKLFSQANAPIVDTPARQVNASSDAKAKAGVTSNKQSNSSNDNDLDIWEDGLSEAELVKRIQAQANKYRKG